MFKSYFTIAFRSFFKDRTYALINLAGLAAGLASVFIIIGYVKYELSYDRHYSNADRVYRLTFVKTSGAGAEESVMLPSPLAATLQDEFPEIESQTELLKNDIQFQVNNEPIKLSSISVDSSFLHMFNFSFVYGNAATALNRSRNVVITESVAQTLFPKQNPVGLSLHSMGYSGKINDYTVTGVIKDIAGNTHFNAQVILANITKREPLSFLAYSSNSQYVMLKPNTSVQKLQQKISSFYKKYDVPNEVRIQFQPVTSIHLYSNIPDEPFANGSIKYIYIFSFVAVLILLIACINYINLTTARSLKRIKEVGVRKVIGAGKKQLALQFITESVLFFCSSLPFAFLLAYALWPLFTTIVHIEAGSNFLLNGQFITAVICLGLLTGMLSGLYPALFLSRLQPISIFNDRQNGFNINMAVRKALIVFQFVISVTLIISTAVVYGQLHLLNNMQLGFNKEHLIVLPYQDYKQSVGAFKNEIKENRNILNICITSWSAGENYGGSSSMDNPSDSIKAIKFDEIFADLDFAKTMQLKIVEGRDFSPAYSADLADINALMQDGKKRTPEEFMNLVSSQSMMITEQTAKELKLQPPYAGQILKYGALQGTVVGVVTNFLGISLLQATQPLVIKTSANTKSGYTYIRIAPTNIAETVQFIEGKWKKFFPGRAFNFSFVDDRLQQLYSSQARLASIFNSFAVLAILIAVLGLFSLVALNVQQKTKEIGIRKVLGASVLQIVHLLSKDFVKLIGLAIVIASPLAWWAMHQWLQDFNYRINISWQIFLAAGAGCLFFAITVVAVQAIKAARANPVKSLRTE